MVRRVKRNLMTPFDVAKVTNFVTPYRLRGTHYSWLRWSLHHLDDDEHMRIMTMMISLVVNRKFGFLHCDWLIEWLPTSCCHDGDDGLSVILTGFRKILKQRIYMKLRIQTCRRHPPNPRKKTAEFVRSRCCRDTLKSDWQLIQYFPLFFCAWPVSGVGPLL